MVQAERVEDGAGSSESSSAGAIESVSDSVVGPLVTARPKEDEEASQHTVADAAPAVDGAYDPHLRMPLMPKWYNKIKCAISKSQKKTLNRLKGALQLTLAYQERLNFEKVFGDNGEANGCGHGHGDEEAQGRRAKKPKAAAIAATSARRMLEVGMGDGENLVSFLKTVENSTAIGCETHRASLANAMKKVEQENLEARARFAGGDAVKFLNRNVEDGSFAWILILFPDPWEEDGGMNRQHRPVTQSSSEGGGAALGRAVVDGEDDAANGAAAASATTITGASESGAAAAAAPEAEKKRVLGDRRIVRKDVIEMIHRKLEKGGVLYISTDVESYAAHVASLFDSLIEGGLSFQGGEIIDDDDKPAWRKVTTTRYERRGVEFGHTIHDFSYVKM